MSTGVDIYHGNFIILMDDARSYIARSSNRSEARIEKADTALAAAAVERLEAEGGQVRIVTTDIDAGEAIVATLDAHGFENRVRFK